MVLTLTQTLAAATEELGAEQFTRFLLALAVLVGLARVFGEICRLIRQPMVLGEILAGVLLGPTVFGALWPWGFERLFPEQGPVYIAEHGFITLAAALLLFVVGMDVDLTTAIRQGRRSLGVSLGGIILPAAVGVSLALVLQDRMGWSGEFPLLPFTLFCGIAMSITALPVAAKVLLDLDLSKTDIGILVLSSAMINDLVGWIGFAVVLALMQSASGDAGAGMHVAVTILMTVGFLGLMLTVGRWVFHWLMPFIQAHFSYPGAVLGLVFVLALLCAAITEAIGIHSIFGAFIAGVVVGDSHHLRQRTRETIQQFIINIFAPVFFASIGLRIHFVESFDLFLVSVVFVAACTGKVLGCFAGARLSRMSTRESWAVGFGMAAQGAIGIILGQLALNQRLIDERLMVAIVIMGLGTSLLSGPLMQKILRRKAKRHLGQVLTERHFISAMRSTTHSEAVRELSRQASKLLEISEEDVYRAVWTRERIAPTGLGDGIAVPHAAFAGLKSPCVILGRSYQGVDFDARDGVPARIICLLISPREDPSTQIELLEMVAKAFHDRETRATVMAAESFTEVRAAINRATSGPDESAEAAGDPA